MAEENIFILNLPVTVFSYSSHYSVSMLNIFMASLLILEKLKRFKLNNNSKAHRIVDYMVVLIKDIAAEYNHYHFHLKAQTNIISSFDVTDKLQNNVRTKD